MYNLFLDNCTLDPNQEDLVENLRSTKNEKQGMILCSATEKKIRQAGGELCQAQSSDQSYAPRLAKHRAQLMAGLNENVT